MQLKQVSGMACSTAALVRKGAGASPETQSMALSLTLVHHVVLHMSSNQIHIAFLFIKMVETDGGPGG